MRLYVFPVAPNPTRVRLYLAEKGIEVEEVMVNLAKGEQRSPEHLKRNPSGALPVLELDDGSFLTESTAIIELFEELHPDPPMLGRDPLERARGRELERIADIGVLHRIGRIVHATRSPLGLPAVPEVAESAARGLPDALAILDGRLADGRPFLGGERPGVADCTLFAAFGFGRFGKVEIPVLERIEAWHGRFAERESARRIAPVG